MLQLFLLLIFPFITTALSSVPTIPTKVLVTGAGGRTGRIVLQKLLSRPAFSPTGIVRTESSKRTLVDELGVPESNVIVADVCDAGAMEECCKSGVDAVVVCTSAVPAPIPGAGVEGGPPVFGFPNGQPNDVDWLGQKNQIDAAKTANPSAHVVICSSMGGTDPSNNLNSFGRSDDDPTKGNILLWKRKAEKYLVDSGLTYTVVHPGGLIDESGGKREIVVGVDDKQMETDNRTIPRADVAELLVASLEHDSYTNRSFDARTKPEGEGAVTVDYDKLLSDLKADCDYTLGEMA